VALCVIAANTKGEKAMYRGERVPGARLRAARGPSSRPAWIAKEDWALLNEQQDAIQPLVGALALIWRGYVGFSGTLAACLGCDRLESHARHTPWPLNQRDTYAARSAYGTGAMGRARPRAHCSADVDDGNPRSVTHGAPARVQDAYSLRCMPQVHGAAADARLRCMRIVAAPNSVE
jgi:histidine ammonia-lyase